MTHHELTLRAEKWLLNTKRCNFVLREFVCCSFEIPDAIGWKYGGSYLVECKTSRLDFKADEKKIFRQRLELGMGNYRYYM